MNTARITPKLADKPARDGRNTKREKLHTTRPMLKAGTSTLSWWTSRGRGIGRTKQGDPGKMEGRIDDIISFLYRERDKYSRDFNGEMVRILSTYIGTLKEVKKFVKGE